MRLKALLKMIAIMILPLLFLSAWLLWTPDRDRAFLERKYLADPGDMIEVLGALLHVRDSGPKGAPVVILLHGFGSSLHTWDARAQGLDPDLRVIRFDLPGSGLSVPDPTHDYTDVRSMQLMRYALPKWLMRKSLEPAYANPPAMTDERATRYYDMMLAPGARGHDRAHAADRAGRSDAAAQENRRADAAALGASTTR